MEKTSLTARVLAAVALAAAVAAVVVGLGSQAGEDGPGRTPAASQGKAIDGPSGSSGKKNKTGDAKSYEVQEGDSLTAIAEKTGVPVETIEELNPGLDPQAIIPGQKLKLR